LGRLAMMYDVFLCHSSQDKEWVQQMAGRIDAEMYNGRNLRSWFDEQHIQAGDRLRPELEAALDASLFVAVVLSAASTKSRWTSFEWNHFGKLHPEGGAIIPLILEKSAKDDLPIEFRGLVHIDFSDPSTFEVGFKQLIQVIAKPSLRTPHIVKSRCLELLSAALTAYKDLSPSEPLPESDALFSYIEELHIDDPEAEGLLLGVLDAMLEHLETLTKPQDYTGSMINGDCEAALLCQNSRTHRLMQKCDERNHWTARFAAARAQSKVAEIQADQVDCSSLIRYAAELDKKPWLGIPDENVLGMIARAAGKMSDTKVGQDLIFALAAGGTASRRAAGGAMSIDPSSPGSWYTLSAMQALERREVRKEPPPPRLIAMLGGLLRDQDREVVANAEEGAERIKRTWPAIRMDAAAARADRFAQPAIPITNGRMLPFSGQIEKVSAKNIVAKIRDVRPQAIYCLTEEGLPDVRFFGASGILILPQGQLSHQCIRLMNAQVPFAQLATPQAMDDLPEGRFVIVRKDGIVS
jgi:hypothetical protein